MSDSIEVLKSWHIEQCGKIKRDRLKRELSKGKPCYFLEGKLINKRQKRINALGDVLLWKTKLDKLEKLLEMEIRIMNNIEKDELLWQEMNYIDQGKILGRNKLAKEVIGVLKE